MRIMETDIQGVVALTPPVFSDNRGDFIKVYNREAFAELGLACDCEEIFYSTSVKDVIRGFHFQLPPMDMEKLVWVSSGEILDLALDLRKNSETFGRCVAKRLSGANHRLLFIPKGVGHAFCVLSSEATVFYQTSRVFSPEHDAGVRWDSVGFTWPITDPILSAKDCKLPALADFESPF